MRFREIELGDALHVKHGYAFKGQFFSDIGTHVVLTPGNFNEEGGFRLRPGKDRYYSGDIPKEFILKEGDLIVAMTEQGPGLLGSSAIIPEDGKYLHNQRIGLVNQLDETLLEKQFLYYLFNTKPVRGQISGSASGTKVRHTAPERLYKVKVLVPSILFQRKIADILSTYDDLMENNRRRIKLLEQTAQLLYQDWFVRLRFPGHEHVKIQDGVPEGWERVPLSQMCIDVRQQVDPTKIEPNTPYIGLEHIPRRSITLQEWGKASDVESSKFAFNSGDILFGKIRPYLHKVVFAITEGISSSDAIVIRPIENWLYEYVLFLISSDEFVALASKTVREGSKMPRADWKFLLSHNFLLPPREILFIFSDAASPIVSQLRLLTLQNRQLAKARDLLLPRLMNGEIAL